MPDTLGPIEIPDAPVIDDFPVVPDYGTVLEIPERIVSHLLDAPGLRNEQRFYMGDGARRFRVRKYTLHCDEYDNLLAHWQTAQGTYAEFDYAHPISHSEFATYRVRYSDPTLTYQHLVDLATSDPGLVLVEVPQTTPTLACTAILERFPDSTFYEALHGQVQRVVPLISIQPRGSVAAGIANTDESGSVTWVSGDKFTVAMVGRVITIAGVHYTVITFESDELLTVNPAPLTATDKPYSVGQAPLYISDRRATVTDLPGGDRLYLPRLREWGGISQSVGENSDQASFTFGNADAVWFDYSNAIDLTRATVDFWLWFAPGTLLKLWRGHITEMRFREDDAFEVQAADGAYELNLAYPNRQISRTCWKQFNDGTWCPFATEGALNPLFPMADPLVCDKGFDTSNGCKAHTMDRYFGGIYCLAQTVRIKDNSTGTWGYGRSQLTSVSIRSDTIYQRPLQEVYTDVEMPVVCDVAMGQDESEFYAAVGVVGEGPIGEFHKDEMKHFIDDQNPHDPKSPGGSGWRYAQGFDPALPGDFFSVNVAPWNVIPPNPVYAAGTSFVDIRRRDTEGVEYKPLEERSITVAVKKGIGGWIWNEPHIRTWQPAIRNPIWIAINVYLKALGLKADPLGHDEEAVSTAQMEAMFDVDAAIECAGICEWMVPPIIPAGGPNEIQYTFRGILKEQKPLRDWLQEILNTCLGYYTFNNGKLRVGMRYNSSVLTGAAFTPGNILHRSLKTEPVLGKFNYLTAEFGDVEFEWQLNKVMLYDVENALYYGSLRAPRYTQSGMSLVGVSTKSQAARIVITRLREELGGTTREEQRKARNVALRTTILALGIYPGQICSVEFHPHMPDEKVEFRVLNWKLNSDWSIDIAGSSTCDSMYDYAHGPKPEDVAGDRPRPERPRGVQGMGWMPNELGPFELDPLYAQGERTFAVWQDYNLEVEGTWTPTVVVRGERVVNVFTEGDAPAIRDIDYESTGGSLPGGRVYYVQVAQQDGAEDAHLAPPSNIAAIYVPATDPPTSTNRLILDPVQIRGAATPGYSLYVGNHVRLMAEQIDNMDTPLPDSITFGGPFVPMTRNQPSGTARRIRIKAKHVIHSGVAGIQVQEVIAPDKIRTSEAKDSVEDWVGQILSVVADASDGAVPLWNFTITAFDNSDGTFTVEPYCVRGTPEDSVEAGDVMIIRSRATAATETTITNLMWKNDINYNQKPEAIDGLIINQEIGLLVRILFGTGKGQVRKIVSNDHFTHTIAPKWTTTPDTTSVYIVEMPDWVSTAEGSDTKVDRQNDRVEIACRLANLDNKVILAGGFLVDDQERETLEPWGVYREIFVYGQPYSVRTTGGTGAVTTVTDQTIRVDTTDGDVNLDLPDLGPYFGRTMLVINDGHGGRVLIHPVGSDEFASGETEIILENFGDWAEFVAAGDPEETAGPPVPAGMMRSKSKSVWTNHNPYPTQHPAYRQRRGTTLPSRTKRFPGRNGKEKL